MTYNGILVPFVLPEAGHMVITGSNGVITGSLRCHNGVYGIIAGSLQGYYGVIAGSWSFRSLRGHY